MKKVILLILSFVVMVAITGCTSEKNYRMTIVTTNYPAYDFARAIVNSSKDVNVEMLLHPGSEIHDYEPTPKDIINIQKSDVFIYVGVESDSWVEKITSNIDENKTRIVRLIDLVPTLNEEIIEGMDVVEEDDEVDEIDEHVWTSPINAINIISKLKSIIIETDSENEKIYEENANEYIEEIKKIDLQIRDIIKVSKRRELIFADRFPFRYFVEEYGLTYYAAFPGCSESVEASAKTVSYLIDKVKKDKIPVVLKIELSNGLIAKTISDATGTKILEFNSAHNISQEDFNKGITYVDIMKKNIEVLKEALN